MKQIGANGKFSDPFSCKWQPRFHRSIYRSKPSGYYLRGGEALQAIFFILWAASKYCISTHPGNELLTDGRMVMNWWSTCLILPYVNKPFTRYVVVGYFKTVKLKPAHKMNRLIEKPPQPLHHRKENSPLWKPDIGNYSKNNIYIYIHSSLNRSTEKTAYSKYYI